MAFDVIVTKAISSELKQLIGYKIDKIYQPSKTEILLGLYGTLGKFLLNICIDSSLYRINLTTHPKENPTIAPNFCMLLRKYLIGYKISNIETNELERVVKIELEDYENENRKTLIVELMGKHSNIILVGSDNVIIDSLRHTNITNNSYRDIFPHQKYTSPKPNENQIQYLKNNYSNLQEVIEASKEHKISFELTKDKKDYVVVLKESKDSFELNFFIDNFYTKKETDSNFISYRNNILKLILDNLKKYNKRLLNINDKLNDCDNMDTYRIYGELLTANLYKVNNEHLDKIEVENYYENNKIIRIPLDKKYTVNENAKRYFKKYNKLKNTLEIVTKQKEETTLELNYIESIVYELENAKTIEDVNLIYDEISENVIFKNKLKNKETKQKKQNKKKSTNTQFKPLEFEIEGFKVLVGRNNKENDWLTCKYASKQDIWFHTKDIHGSHVILKTENKKHIENEVLVECAKLAAKNSKAKNSQNVPVDYCKVQYVKKPNNAKPGMVIYTNNKTLYV